MAGNMDDAERPANIHHVLFTLDGTVYHAPEMWRVGRSMARQREGLGVKAAYLAAMRDWAEQERLAAEHDRQHA